MDDLANYIVSFCCYSISSLGLVARGSVCVHIHVTHNIFQ